MIMNNRNLAISLKNLFVFCLLILLSGLYSCTSATKVQISINLENEFPVISIHNPGGEDVTIQPISSTIGSIGFVA